MFTILAKLGGLVTMIAFVLSACSALKPDEFSCDDNVTAIEVGSRVELISPDTRQPIMVRFNGVSASCYLNEEGLVFDVSVGLKIKRDLKESSEVSRIQVPLIIAIVDGSENVTEYDSFAYRMALSKQIDSLYPVVDFKAKAPKDGRIILSLVPEVIKLNN